MRQGKISQGTGQTENNDPMPSQHKIEPQAAELQKLLKQFAYQPVYFTQSSEETRRARSQLEFLLKAHTERVQGNVVQEGCALLEWVLLCPPLLRGQPGFEWIQENFIKLLMQRLHRWDFGQKATLDNDQQLCGIDDQLFWNIVEKVRGKLNKGHPQSMVKDYERANRLMFLMSMKNAGTGQPIIEIDAARMVAQWEVLQRVLDGSRLLIEVGGLSKQDAKRRVASWGMYQRARAVDFLKHSCDCPVEDCEKVIDDWNAKQKIRRAKEFFKKERNYSETEAQAIVTQLRIGELRGKDTTEKDAAIQILAQQHGYEEGRAGRIVNSWGVTDITGSEDPSPISRSLRVVKEQGLWDVVGVAGRGSEEDARVLNLLSKPILTKEEVHQLKRLTTKLSENWNSSNEQTLPPSK